MLLATIAACQLACGSRAHAPAEPWPTNGWRVDTPESQGVDSAKLADAIDLAVRDGLPIHGLLIVRNGVLVLESYFYPYDPHIPHDVASVTKSVTSILTGIAIDQGYLQSADEPAIPILTYGARSDDPRRDRITIANLLSMTSGLECGALNAALPFEPELVAMRHTTDWIDYAVHLPMRLEPGSRFAYCSVNNHLLSGLITRQSGMTLLDFARANLFAPLGITEARWPADPAGLNHGWADLHLMPRDVAKLGYLYLRHGVWDSRQVVSEKWVSESFVSRIEVTPGVEYGYSWWLNTQRQPHIPEAIGRGGQRISLVPDKHAVVVFLGGGLNTNALAPLVVDALKSEAPLPPNPAASARLEEALARARRAPASTPTAAVSPTAASVSHVKYRLPPNAVDLETVALSFDGGAASFELRLGGEVWRGPIGMQGVYAMSPEGHQGMPLGARGRWISPSTFELDVNLIENISHLVFTLRFHGTQADVHVADTTGSIDTLDLTATAESRASGAVLRTGSSSAGGARSLPAQ